MKKLISLFIVILMMVSLVSCNPPTEAKSDESPEKITVFLPTVDIINDHILISKEDVPESEDYLSYLAGVAAYYASQHEDKDKIDCFVFHINEYKFYVSMQEGEVTQVSYEEVGE